VLVLQVLAQRVAEQREPELVRVQGLLGEVERL